MVSFTEAVTTCMTKKFATMKGRATRAEYWWFQLFIWLTITAICVLGNSLGDKDGSITILIAFVFWLITLIPNLCVCVRRLHDRGHSGAMFWWCLLGWAVGLLIINIVNLLSSVEDNEYGPNPFKRTPQQTLDKEGKTQDENKFVQSDEMVTNVNL